MLLAPNSIEIEDTYLRLDRFRKRFFQQLDKKSRKRKTIWFSCLPDHGAAHSEGYMQANKMATGFFGEGLEKH